jgi:hypothetical protein
MIPPKGKDSVPVFTVAGHSMRVHREDPEDGKEGTVVPQKFKKQALSLGCIFVGDVYDEDADEDGAPSQQALVLAGIEEILNRDDEAELEKDGRPKMAALKKQVGFNVTKAQFSAAWADFEKTLI